MSTTLPRPTERLVLRDFVEADWPQVQAYASDPEVVRYMSWGPNSEEETRDFLRQKLEAQAADPRAEFDLAVVLRDTGRLIGACGITVSSARTRCAWVGYCFHRDFWGQGYATEAARAVVGFGFEALGLHRIFSTCDTENLASARVLEKVGMRREGHVREDALVRGRWRDSYLYAVLEQDWAGD